MLKNKFKNTREYQNIWKIIFIVFTMIFYTNNIYSYDNIAQIYDSTYGQDGNNNPNLALNFNTQSFIQNNFSHNTITNNQRLYVNNTGIYKISYSCTWEAIIGNNVRRIYQNYIRINGVTNLIPSESDVYLRGNDLGSQAGGHISSTSATLLANLSNGDYIELRGGEDPANTNNGQTITTNDCFLSAQKLNTRAIEVYDNSGGLDIRNNPVINLSQVYYNGDNSLFSLNNNQINVSEDGWYKLSYTSCIEQITGGGGSQRQSPQSWIRKNSNSNISLSFSFAGYTRNNAADDDKNCNRANTLINLSSGDYIELQTGIFTRDSDRQVDTQANQGWLILEKIEMDSSIISINNSGQQIDHGVPSAVSFDLNNKLGDYISHTGSSSKIYFDKSGLYELAYNIGYQDGSSGDRVITCGYLKMNGNTNISPSKQCIYTRGLSQARTGTLSTTSIINVSKNDYIEILVEVEGEVGSNEYIQVQKGTTWFTLVKINETVQTNWENSTLNIGTSNLNLGNISKSTNIKILGEGSNNLTINCISGNCSTIIHNHSNGTNFTALIEETSVLFTCKDSNVGNFSALFNLSSNEDKSFSQINVSCNIAQTYGLLNIELDIPLVGSTSIIFQNETFKVNATIFCTGTNGAICGNLSNFVRYNNSISSFENISISNLATPFWTSSSQPQYCELNAGENCNISWDVNASGTINTLHKLNVNSSSNFNQIISNVSGNTTINITIAPPGEIIWSGTNLNLGEASLNLGNKTGTSKLLPDQNHSSVIVNCFSGSCNIIKDDFSDGINISDGIDHTVTFTCIDNQTGSYSALFHVNSSEDPSISSINVSCSIKQTYGYLDLNVTYPPIIPTITKVKQYNIFQINSTIICQGTNGAHCGNVNVTPRYGEPNINLGDGSDGSLSISSINTIINNYSYLSSTETSGTTTITLNDATEFSSGDEVLIIQIQDGGGVGTAGNFEFNTIASKLGNDITLNNGLTYTYGSGTFDIVNSISTQIVRIPQYTNLTITNTGSITSPAWDGFSGGIVAFRLQNSLNTSGYINVSEKGFRGGDCNACGNNAWGDQGEGTNGKGSQSTASNGNGGGGGYGPGSSGEAGSGGGYGTTGIGGSSENPSSGGSSIGSSDLSKIYFGGGAGAGGDNNGRTPNPEFVNGGGIIIIFANKIENARIISNGEKGIYGSSGINGGVSGSGAGGSIWLNSISQILIDVTALGESSTNGYSGDIGGAGGDGRIRLDYLSSNGNSQPNAGYTNTSFSDEMVLISTNNNSIPFYTLTNQSLNCGFMFKGDSCLLTWEINVTGIIGISYNLDINLSSNQSQVPDNESINSKVKIHNDPFITILRPLNNSIHKISSLFAEIISDTPLTYAGFYLNGNLSNKTDLSQITSINWDYPLGQLGIGNYNITFVYNTSLSNFTSYTHFFEIINISSEVYVKKLIKNINLNMYLIKINITNQLNKSMNFTFIDFVHSSYIPGSFNINYNWSNLTNLGYYSGEIFGWELNFSAYESKEINYSISGISDHSNGKNFIFAIE